MESLQGDDKKERDRQGASQAPRAHSFAAADPNPRRPGARTGTVLPLAPLLAFRGWLRDGATIWFPLISAALHASQARRHQQSTGARCANRYPLATATSEARTHGSAAGIVDLGLRAAGDRGKSPRCGSARGCSSCSSENGFNDSEPPRRERSDGLTTSPLGTQEQACSSPGRGTTAFGCFPGAWATIPTIF